MKLMKIGALVMAVLMALAFAAGCTGGVATETPQQPSNPTDNQPPQATAGQGEQPPAIQDAKNNIMIILKQI